MTASLSKTPLKVLVFRLFLGGMELARVDEVVLVMRVEVGEVKVAAYRNLSANKFYFEN